MGVPYSIVKGIPPRLILGRKPGNWGFWVVWGALLVEIMRWCL